MRKYLGIVSILILMITFIIVNYLVDQEIGYLWAFVIAGGYIASVLASWYSTSGFWRKSSATILIVLPVGYIILIVLFMVGMSDF